jgi:hypothetical protein
MYELVANCCCGHTGTSRSFASVVDLALLLFVRQTAAVTHYNKRTIIVLRANYDYLHTLLAHFARTVLIPLLSNLLADVCARET